MQAMENDAQPEIVELTATIVSPYVSNNTIIASDSVLGHPLKPAPGGIPGKVGSAARLSDGCAELRARPLGSRQEDGPRHPPREIGSAVRPATGCDGGAARGFAPAMDARAAPAAARPAAAASAR